MACRICLFRCQGCSTPLAIKPLDLSLIEEVKLFLIGWLHFFFKCLCFVGSLDGHLGVVGRSDWSVASGSRPG